MQVDRGWHDLNLEKRSDFERGNSWFSEFEWVIWEVWEAEALDRSKASLVDKDKIFVRNIGVWSLRFPGRFVLEASICFSSLRFVAHFTVVSRMVSSLKLLLWLNWLLLVIRVFMVTFSKTRQSSASHTALSGCSHCGSCHCTADFLQPGEQREGGSGGERERERREGGNHRS